MERLIEFLIGLGIEPVEGEKQVYAFNDAIVTLEVDYFGNNIMSVELYDYVEAIDEELAHFIDDAMNEEDDEDYDDGAPVSIFGGKYYAEDDGSGDDEEEYTQSNPLVKMLVGGMLKSIVDELLDEYNDNMSLYMAFGDSEYYERCEEILRELEKIKL